MAERRLAVFDPTSDVVDQINGLVLPQMDPKSPNRGKLGTSATQFHTQYESLEALLKQKTGSLRWPTKGFLVAEAMVDRETLRIGEARDNLQISTDLDLVTYRVLQRLHATSVSQMPLWMVMLKVVTRAPKNPLQAIEAVVEKDKRKLDQSRKRLENVQRRVAKEIDPEVHKTQDELGRLKKVMVGIWRPVVLPNFDLTGQYVRYWPSQAREMSIAYGKAHVEEESRGEKVKAFERRIKREFPIDSVSANFVRSKYIEYLAEEALAVWIATAPEN